MPTVWDTLRTVWDTLCPRYGSVLGTPHRNIEDANNDVRDNPQKTDPCVHSMGVAIRTVADAFRELPAKLWQHKCCSARSLGCLAIVAPRSNSTLPVNMPFPSTHLAKRPIWANEDYLLELRTHTCVQAGLNWVHDHFGEMPVSRDQHRSQ